MARWAVVKDSMRCHEGEIRLPERAKQNVVEDFTNTHGQDHGVVRTT